jgi:hypothetical protein
VGLLPSLDLWSEKEDEAIDGISAAPLSSCFIFFVTMLSFFVSFSLLSLLRLFETVSFRDSEGNVIVALIWDSLVEEAVCVADADDDAAA